MRGITIILNDEAIHTGNDLDLVQERKDLGKPTVQSYTIQVPGRNGLLNLTKGLTGNVAYYNRLMTFQYVGSGTHEQLLEIDARLSQYHGETVRIIDDDYPDHYYEGEASVSVIFHHTYVTITLVINALPFRYKTEKTVFSRAINGATTLTLNNESIDATPTITVTAATTITFNGITAKLSAGTYEDARLALHRGVNNIEVSGTGTITIEYQEGAI